MSDHHHPMERFLFLLQYWRVLMEQVRMILSNRCWVDVEILEMADCNYYQGRVGNLDYCLDW
jgi:hypothetical protein